jgi:hypothetical protein
MLVPMLTAVPPPTPRTPGDPWFRGRPHVTIAVTTALFVAVFTVRLLVDSPAEAYSMFYALPVALAATAFGLRGGVVSGLLAIVLIVVWALVRGVSLSPGGWATRVVPILLLAVLLGEATDRARRAERERHRLEQAALLHREAIEINDVLIQRMTAAKWSLEAGHTEDGLKALTLAMTEAEQLVSGLIRRAGMGDRSEHLPDAAGGNPSTPNGRYADEDLGGVGDSA